MIVAVTDLDYERTNLILVNVRTTDAGSPSKFFDKLITVVVGNAQEAPTVTGSTCPIDENSADNTYICGVTASAISSSAAA